LRVLNEQSFHELKERVMDTKLCIFCGTCTAVCPVGCIAFKGGGPELARECTACGRCLEACPGLGAPLQELDSMVFGRTRSEVEKIDGLGIRLKDRNLSSSDQEIFFHGYNGGKVTTMLAYLLEKKETDGVVISCWWRRRLIPILPGR
jgi:coenzyme F420-reducing hydrogenase beta subunit